MKLIKWKILIITCVFSLLPILLGVVLWDRLPETIAIHFNLYNEPDNFAPKSFVVFAFPVLMTLLQIFCCVSTDINGARYGDDSKIGKVTKWISPFLSIVLQSVTLAFSIGINIDVRRIVSVLIGVIFLVVGKYIPELDYVKNKNIDAAKARKINLFIGIGYVVMGIMFMTSAFFSTVATIICIILLIPYGIISAVYSIMVEKKQD